MEASGATVPDPGARPARRSRRVLLVGSVLLGIVVVVVTGLAVFLLLTLDRGPARPDVIARGDHTYTVALAEHRFDRLLASRHVPGGALALIVGQDVIWETTSGLADVATERPVTRDTVFKAWSLAKVFTAIETMRLVEEGRLDLDAPIEDLVPDFAIQSRFGPGEPITPRRILAHRSGLPRTACVDDQQWHQGPDGVDRLAAALADCYLAYPVGSRFKYANVGYDLLGYLVQRERGVVFPRRLAEALLQPIGMDASAFWSTALPGGSGAGADIATGHEWWDGRYVPLDQYDVATVPSGNLWTTIDDLVAFAQFIFRDGEAGGRQLIEAATLAAMTEDQFARPEDPQLMGLGWKLSDAIPDETLVWADGGPTEGTGALVALLPERELGVVMLGNSTGFEGAATMPVAVELLEVMLETETGIRPEAETAAGAEAIDPALQSAAVGDYALMGDVFEVQAAGDGLEASLGGFTVELVPRTDGRFGVTHWLNRLGLTRFLDLPFDLDAISVEFRPDDEPASGTPLDGVAIVDFGGVDREVAPRIPPLPGGTDAWAELAGRYERFVRRVDGSIGAEPIGAAEIDLDGDRLVMSGSIGPLGALDERTLIVLSGPFAGETIVRDPASGTLTHQSHIYRPVAAEG